MPSCAGRKARKMTDNTVPEMLPIKEVIKRIPYLSYDHVRQLCLTGKIVHIRSGAKYLVNFGKLCEYLNNGGRTDG